MSAYLSPGCAPYTPAPGERILGHARPTPSSWARLAANSEARRPAGRLRLAERELLDSLDHTREEVVSRVESRNSTAAEVHEVPFPGDDLAAFV